MKNTVFFLICGILLLLSAASFRRASFAPANLTGNPAELPWAPGDFDDGSQIDLLVVYTQSAVNEHGTEQKMKDYIIGEVTKLNNALANSGIDLEVNLVHQQLLSGYVENNDYGVDLTNVQSNATVAALRDDLHADIVVLMRNNSGNLAGKAQSPFAVTRNKNNHSFSHEVGHIFGAMHSDDPCTNGCRAFSSGFQSCVMAGGIFAYSTPSIVLSGVAHGSATANASSTITNGKTAISQQRGSSVKWTGSVSTDWNTAGNWTYLKGAAKTPTPLVPRATDDVLIPSGVSRYPVINGNASMRSITTQPGASLTIQSGTIDVYGNWYGNGNLTSNGGTVNFRSPNAKGATVQQATGSFKAVSVKTGTLVKLNSNLSVPGNLTVEKAAALAQTGRTITPLPVDLNATGDVFFYTNCDNGAAASPGQTSFELPVGWAGVSNSLPKDCQLKAASNMEAGGNKCFKLYGVWAQGVNCANGTMEAWMYSPPVKLQKGSYKVSMKCKGDQNDAFNCQVYLMNKQLPAAKSIGSAILTQAIAKVPPVWIDANGTFTVAESGTYYLGFTNQETSASDFDWGYDTNVIFLDDIKITRN